MKYSTINNFLIRRGIFISLTQILEIKTKAIKWCDRNSIPVKRIPDKEFGIEDKFPTEILKKIVL